MNIIRNINSEEPDNHWGFLNYRDKVVLDLGCARFYSSISTAQWFLNGGAKQVVGVDLSREMIDSPKVQLLAMQISNRGQLEELLEVTRPEVIKCDIEGAEVNFDGISTDLMASVVEIGVEYHDPNTKDVMLKMLSQWGFNTIDIYTLMGLPVENQGVVHGKR